MKRDSKNTSNIYRRELYGAEIKTILDIVVQNIVKRRRRIYEWYKMKKKEKAKLFRRKMK